MDDFLESIERDARKILHASNERRIKLAKGEYDGLASSPVVKKQNASSSKSLSPSQLASLSNKAIALSSPKRQPLMPSSRPVEPSGITSSKVLRGLSSSSGSSASGRNGKAAASSSSPFLGSPLKLDPPKNKKQSSTKQRRDKNKGSSSKSLTTAQSPVRKNITKKQLLSSLAVSSTSGSTTDQAGGGPIELDIEILRKKYRCEQTRAEAHEAYVKRVELRALVNGNGVGGDGQADCLVVAEDEPPVEKHPVQARVEELVKRENERARERSRRKLESNAWEMEVRKECLSELNKLWDEERKAIRMDGEGGDDNAYGLGDGEEYGEPPEPLCHDVEIGPSEEDIIRNPSPNLSMKLAGGELDELSTLIPGCTAIGPAGGLHTVDQDGNTDKNQGVSTVLKDRTQAVACFTRDPTTSAPKVTIAQAIETPMLAEPTIAFDPTQIKPPPAQHEKPSGIMPDVYPPNDIIDRTPLVSPTADARPSTIVVLDPNATEGDYASAISVDDGDDSGSGDGPRIQHRRHMKEVTLHGFPTKCYAAPFEVDASAVTHDVGITEEGITMPEPAVSDIMTCLPGECTTESLSTEKTPLDYLYIAKDPSSGKDGGTPNEGSLFTVLMDRYEISSIARTTERKQQAEQDRLQEVQAENRKKAKRAKIKAATELMERRLAAEREKILRQEAPGGHENVAGKGEDSINDRIEPLQDDDGEEAWERRMKCSVIVTVRDLGDAKWEERQLMDTRKHFYRNVDPYLILSDASSWNPPLGWDRVALPAPDISDCGEKRVGMDMSEDEKRKSADNESSRGSVGEEDNNEIDRLATLLTRNDEFVKAMAARLGVPEDKVRSLGEDSCGNSDNNDKKNHKDSVASDWSHTEDIHEELAALPQGFADVYAIKCAERERQQREGMENIDPRDLGGGARGCEWRKLPRAIVRADFFHLNKRKVQSCADKSSFCQPNKPRLVGLVDPVKGIQREVNENEFQTELTTLFISDIRADHFKMVEDQKKQKEQEESLLDASQQEALEQILNLSVDDGEAGTITVDAAEMAASPDRNVKNATRHSQPEMVDLKGKSNAELTVAAIDAVKSANYNVLEHVLDEIGLSVNCRDEHGNTLLIIASQRGRKRMVKFLLRRNANMNAQNFVGCTALHYLYEYGHDRLAEYLLSKGASDEIINKAGLTVYEGLGHSPDE